MASRPVSGDLEFLKFAYKSNRETAIRAAIEK